jgi:hypothetical protein
VLLPFKIKFTSSESSKCIESSGVAAKIGVKPIDTNNNDNSESLPIK